MTETQTDASHKLASLSPVTKAGFLRRGQMRQSEKAGGRPIDTASEAERKAQWSARHSKNADIHTQNEACPDTKKRFWKQGGRKGQMCMREMREDRRERALEGIRRQAGNEKGEWEGGKEAGLEHQRGPRDRKKRHSKITIVCKKGT